MSNDPKEKWTLPDALRVDLPTNESRARLAAANAEQAELAERVGSPFAAKTPQDKERQRAEIIAGDYESIGREHLTSEQLDEWANAYAVLGYYNRAVAVAHSPALVQEIKEIAAAIARPDEDDCKCGRQFSAPVREVYSRMHRSVVTVMKCSKCGLMNAADAPDHLLAARAKRAEIRAKYSGLSPLDARDAMVRDGLLKG